MTAPNGKPMKNVFQLWAGNDKKLPFKVRRWSWHPSTYFLVKEIKDVKWDYFKKTGKLYGKAYGDMYLRGKLTEKNMKLNSSGSYQWHFVNDNHTNQLLKRHDFHSKKPHKAKDDLLEYF